MSIKRPEKLLGYLKYNNIDYPFEFIEEDFSIVLFPPTVEEWNEASDIFNFFSDMNRPRAGGWIKSIRLEGITSENYKIVFSVKDAPSNYHGFKSYEVDWFYYCRPEYEFDQIEGYRVSGPDVNYFFPSQIALQNEIKFGDNKSIEKMIVSTTEKETKRDCGNYSVKRGLKASIELNAFATMHNNTALNPIDAASYMYFVFSKPVGIDDLLLAVYHTRCFMKFVSYRNNVCLSAIETFYLKEEKRDFGGMIVFPSKREQETHRKAAERIIKYDVLQKKTANIFKAIKQQQMGYAHICNSIDDRRYFSSGRMIMIMSEFEREFRNIYGQDYGRSEEYIAVKNEIVDLIEEYRKSKSGSAKKYAASIKRTVSNLDNSYAQKVSKAFLNCNEIMKPFVTKNYSGYSEEILQGISDRVGEIRNGIAHSKTNFKLDAIHLTDTKIMEELTYAIRLKKAGISDDNAIKGINALFGENLVI